MRLYIRFSVILMDQGPVYVLHKDQTVLAIGDTQGSDYRAVWSQAVEPGLKPNR